MREWLARVPHSEDTAGRGAQFEFGLASVFTALARLEAWPGSTRPLKGVDVSRGRVTAFSSFLHWNSYVSFGLIAAGAHY